VNKEQNRCFVWQAFDYMINQCADFLLSRSTDHPIIR
jgi:hypothetical protein